MRRLVVIALLAYAACGGDAVDPDLVAERQLPEAVAADVQAVSHANNQFALDMLRVLPPNGNQFFSPFSISTALWMLDAGAAGETDAELRAALHATLPGTQAHEAYGAMLDSLEIGRSFDLYTLATANRLFGQEGFAFQQPFLDITADAYGAPLQPVDFRADAVAIINAWVSAQTDGMIPALLPPVPADTVLVLVNAIVFKGKWRLAFDRQRTHPAPFTLASGAQVDVTMMDTTDLLRVGPIAGGQLGVLPFRGQDLSMIVLVPDEANGLPALEANLTADSLAAAIASASGADEHEVRLKLPKFGFETEVALPQTLQALGIVSAFDPSRADLSGIDGTRSLYVDTAVHKAVISIDEDGATASAATGIGSDTVSQPPELAMDRPFLFAIYDHVTGSILFLGRVDDPR